MKLLVAIFIMATAAAVAFFSFGESTASSEVTASAEKPKKTLSAFKSESELETFFQKLKKNHTKRFGGGGGGGKEENSTGDFSMSVTETVTVSSAPMPAESLAGNSITNVQHAGVDEGGIVKLHGVYLIILRRGRLFTVSIKNGDLRPVSSIDAFGPGMNPNGSWYDEMLVSGDTIVVIGFSYGRGGTEVGVFNINESGGLRYRSTYHLRSNDYYSSRNYASRLVGKKLIFYSPLFMSFDTDKVADSLPAIRKWKKGVSDGDFKRIPPANRIYLGQRDFEQDENFALHTVTTCDISDSDLSCEATSVIGPSGNVFYVSPGSVYVWASNWSEDKARPVLYRMPLDGSAPSALEVSGSPVDQFSFLESKDGNLNVLVRSESRGDGMWASETTEGDVALMRIALTSFADGTAAVPASQYRPLIKPDEDTFQNRFVGDYIFYGTGSGWDLPKPKVTGHLYAARWDGTGGLWKLPLSHGVDRIELMGPHSMVIGTDGTDLHFTSVRLDAGPALAGHYRFENASQGELRSHGFFYKPDDANSGMLGLPVRGPGRPGYAHLYEDSASILFLRNKSLGLKPIGELKPDSTRVTDDGCKASCVDWYGNARPLFIGGRIFALLGYEIVEGSMKGDSISEARRANFAPAKANSAGQ